MQRIIGEIPARIGSQRVKKKNLRLIAGKPLISYAIEASVQSTLLTEVYVNTDDDEIGMLGLKQGVKYYKRASHLANDTATSDEFNYDFIKATNADILVMINPVSPLITTKHIDEVISYYLANDFDTVITVFEEQRQALYQDQPINFNINQMLPRQQDLLPIQLCSWAVSIWRGSIFMQAFEEKGRAVFSGRVGYYPLDKITAIKISTEEDFLIAEQFLKLKNKQ